MLFIQTLSVP